MGYKTNLYCTDGHIQTAIAKYSKKQWTIYGYTSDGFTKVLFDTTFEDLIPFNSMLGVSYVAVKKKGLWGLIRFRQNTNKPYYIENQEKICGKEPFDENLIDVAGREIKLIEDFIYPDVNLLKEKYKLDKKYDNKIGFDPNKIGEWSDELIKETIDSFYNMDFMCNSKGQVRMKRNDGSLGYISIGNATSDKYHVENSEDGYYEKFSSVSEMIDAGWVLD